MTIKKKPSAADLLNRQINSTKRMTDPTITDPFAQAVAKRLESRGIAKVPGLPDDGPELTGLDVLIELHRNRELQAQRQAQRQAEEEAAKRPSTTAGLLAAAIAAQVNTSAPSAHVPLNGTAVLRAALAGGAGTINSQISQGRNE